jgi:hypothetical protein
MAAWDDPELEAAYVRCCQTVREPLPCLLPEYLAARRDYHTLLRAKGMQIPLDSAPRSESRARTRLYY